GADKLVPWRTDDEDAVLELGQPEGVRAAGGGMILDGKDGGVPVARPEPRQHAHQLDDQEVSIVRAERVDACRLATQGSPAHRLIRVGMMCLDRVREHRGISHLQASPRSSRLRISTAIEIPDAFASCVPVTADVRVAATNSFRRSRCSSDTRPMSRSPTGTGASKRVSIVPANATTPKNKGNCPHISLITPAVQETCARCGVSR